MVLCNYEVLWHFGTYYYSEDCLPKVLLRLDFCLLSSKYSIVDHHVANGAFHGKKYFHYKGK
jgi:hypothetical protein